MIGAVLAKRTIPGAFAAIEDREIEKVMADVADDAVWEYPGHSRLSGRFEGKEAIRAQWECWFAGVRHIRFALDHVAVENLFAMGATNTVMVEWRAEVEDLHGNKYEPAGVTAIDVRSGKVARIKDYFYDPTLLTEFWGPEKAKTAT